MDLTELGAAEAAEAIRDGRITSAEFVAACLERIAAREPAVGAWAFLDRDLALSRAGDADALRRSGQPLGPLHGVPVGLKDVIDTADLPTENGTALHAGRRPAEDAAVAVRLRAAGAAILGKTVTAELATYAPGKTRNPHNPEHTPGGSSSGSAAAVAANMVPLAVGTQTNGSTIRPAAYCGIYGFKPSRGMISRRGVLRQSRLLDQIGVFARSIDDAALIADALAGHDRDDPDTLVAAPPALLEISRRTPPVAPRLAFVKTPAWDKAAPETHEAFAELTEHLGGAAQEVALSDYFAEGFAWHRLIMEADIARSFAPLYERGRDQLSESLRGQIERGRQVTTVNYNRAVDHIPFLDAELDELFHQFDAILTPAATGTAPKGLHNTGDPIFCTLWTLCGLPAATLPLLQGENGLPLGVQLVGRKHYDGRLLRTARWLLMQLAGS